MSDNQFKFDTLMIHAGQQPDSDTLSMSLPIYQTTAYAFRDVEHAKNLFELKEGGNIYTRLQNPTNDVLEKRVAALDGGVGGLTVSSGHAAIFMTIANLCSAGDEIVSSICIYGGAVNMMGISLDKLGIKVKFVNPDDLNAWEDAITDKTKACFVEGVGNPNANVADIENIAKIAHSHGIPLIVDSTFTTPYLQRPIEWGADIVLHSATKFLGGHGTSMSGVVVDSGNFEWLGNPRFPDFNQPDPGYHGIVYAKDFGKAAFITKLRTHILRDYGSCASPFNSFLILQGIETLSLRMRKHCDNALAVARYLNENPQVEFVHYPMLENNSYHSLAMKYLPLGCGSVFTFGLKGGRERGARFINNLKLLSHVANVGDVRSLVIHPATTTHSQLSDEQLEASGITPSTVRLSIGLEDASDIIADIDRAIEISK
ncbi:MAG TPA: O-acetylhomoserine aminocarboxypropyltransferase/cysteine synthase family protein [Clostridia bacterium]|nr:O-acetylhomoserine aminocarboxypropyltransferase/cysteine synthase family protein [Clostridia bacterium]